VLPPLNGPATQRPVCRRVQCVQGTRPWTPTPFTRRDTVGQLGRRKLLEVLFDGRPEAEALLKADAQRFFTDLAADRKLTTIPADTNASAKLARHYSNASLGEIAVSTSGSLTIFDFGERKSEVGSRKNPDGTISFLSIVSGRMGSEFVVGSGPKRTLITRDAQHEYVFDGR